MLTLQLFRSGGKVRLVVGCALPGGLLPGRCGAIGHNLFPAIRPTRHQPAGVKVCPAAFAARPAGCNGINARTKNNNTS